MTQRENRPLCKRREFSCAFQILIFFGMTAAAYAQSAFVRVNQVGYVAGSSKRAYLMASGSETGATFVVKNSTGSIVFGPAAIAANLGSWSNTYKNVYALDFDTLTARERIRSASAALSPLPRPASQLIRVQTSMVRRLPTACSFIKTSAMARTLSLPPYEPRPGI